MSDEILRGLVLSGSLPRTLMSQGGDGTINRWSNIRAEYDEGGCGPLPLRVTAYGAGGLKQPPRNSAYLIVEEGAVNSGADEVRANIIRRFTGGPARS